ncbi:hypothetical protein K3495_g14798, partial [Podosphaera aphanis]
MRWAITTNTKDQIAPQLVKWVEHQHHQFGKRVRTIFKEGGSEFSRIKTYCDQHGIRTDVSAPYTPEQNGASEVSNKKWSEGITPHATFNEDIVFGDELNSIERQNTISYWSNHDSIFSEPSFNPAYPSHNTRTTTPHQETPEDQREDPPSTPDHSVINIQREEIYDTAPSSPITIPHLDSYDFHIEPSSPLTSTPSHSTDLQVISYDQQLADQREISYEEPFNDEAELTEQDEPYDQVMTGWDPVQPVAGVKRPHSPEGDITKSQRGRTIKRIDYHRLHHGKTAQVSTDPQTWDQAMTSPEASHWKKAAEEEFKSLKQKGAIKIIPQSQVPQGRKPMKSKWVFKKKYLANGDIEKYKARCTAKGFTQRQGIDYHETFTPTPRAETGRIILVLAHQLGWHRKQGDVPTAFLNPDLNIELFMELPKGYEKDVHVIKLCKGLYGLKQAEALWYDDAKSTLAQLGLFPTTSDICLYTNDENDLFVLMHVDDFQVVSPHQSKIDRLMSALYHKYNLKTVSTDLFLGIEI